LNDQNRLIEETDILKFKMLREIPFFSSIPEKNLNLLVKHCGEVQLKDGEVLCKEGDVERKMYVIISGQLLIYKLKRKIDIANPGEYLGEMLLIDSQPRSASIKAIGDVKLLEIGDEDFKQHILSDPKAISSLARKLIFQRKKERQAIFQD